MNVGHLFVKQCILLLSKYKRHFFPVDKKWILLQYQSSQLYSVSSLIFFSCFSDYCGVILLFLLFTFDHSEWQWHGAVAGSNDALLYRTKGLIPATHARIGLASLFFCCLPYFSPFFHSFSFLFLGGRASSIVRGKVVQGSRQRCTSLGETSVGRVPSSSRSRDLIELSSLILFFFCIACCGVHRLRPHLLPTNSNHIYIKPRFFQKFLVVFGAINSLFRFSKLRQFLSGPVKVLMFNFRCKL